MTPALPSLSETLAPVTEGLNALSPAERLHWMRGLGRRELASLYQLAEAAGLPISVDQLVGAEGEVVIHEGQNSLPMFTQFQKRMVRTADGAQGYNHQTMSAFTGPGHFTIREEPGAVLFDYISLAGSAPAEFPALKPNDVGLSKLVYGGMIDRCYRVSADAIIGRAFKGHKPMSAWFMLLRQG